MNWNDKIELGKVTETVVYGEPIQSVAWTKVFANKRAVRQSEFYAASNVGLKPELMFEINSDEFDGHSKVKYGTTEYEIIRTYDKGEVMELTVAGKVGDG